MAINTGGGGQINRNVQTPADFTQAREARQARLDAKVSDAQLQPNTKLDAKEIKAHQGFYNGSIGDIDKLKGDNKLESLKDLKWDKMFPVPSDWRINNATKPNLLDNKDAREVRSEYANANNEANRERTQASRTSEKLGPGEHTLSNGDKVKVTTDPKTGETTVTTTRQDGSTKTVSYNENNSENVSVSRKDQFGNEETLEKDGTKITKGTDNKAFGGIFGKGGETSTTYDINKDGEPTRTETGPGKDDWERTTANKNGSSDTRKLIYRDENGRPAYEDKHEGNALQPFPGWPPERPEPWRPFPHPQFPWDLDPFRPIPRPIDGWLNDVRPN